MKIQMKLYSAKSSRNPIQQATGEADVDIKGFKAPLVDMDYRILKDIENHSSGSLSAMAFVMAEMAQCGTGAPIWRGCRPTAMLEVVVL